MFPMTKEEHQMSNLLGNQWIIGCENGEDIGDYSWMSAGTNPDPDWSMAGERWHESTVIVAERFVEIGDTGKYELQRQKKTVGPGDPCDAWEGSEFPGQEWWVVAVEASEDRKAWPAGGRNVAISPHYKTEHEALAARDALEALDGVALITPSGDPKLLMPIQTERLVVDHQSYRGSKGPCQKCQNPHYAHQETS